jgi:hypothetical protein
LVPLDTGNDAAWVVAEIEALCDRISSFGGIANELVGGEPGVVHHSLKGNIIGRKEEYATTSIRNEKFRDWMEVADHISKCAVFFHIIGRNPDMKFSSISMQ